ncbi:MAG: toxin-antitoxin system YwqK family antitoxin [Phycisphaerae bacterium]
MTTAVLRIRGVRMTSLVFGVAVGVSAPGVTSCGHESRFDVDGARRAPTDTASVVAEDVAAGDGEASVSAGKTTEPDPSRLGVIRFDSEDGVTEYSVMVSETGTPLVDEHGVKLFHGTTYVWYTSGEKRAEGDYVRGVRDGLWTWWYKDGNLYVQGTYLDGEQDGVWTYWNPDGSVNHEEVWSRGERVDDPGAGGGG